MNELAQKQQDMMKTYKEELARGLPRKDAAKIAQKRSGLSIRTGMPIKGSAPKLDQRTRLTGNVARKPSLTGFGLY